MPPLKQTFESRTEVWREVGLGSQIDRAEAKRARGGVVVRLILIAGVLFLFSQRRDLFPGYGTPVRIATVILLAVLGWGLAQALFRGLAPELFRRLEPGVAGTVGFLIRLLTVALTIIVALRIAGLDPKALAVGGAFTAIVLGLAAQQTLANLFAGVVLLSTRPFRVGERVVLQGGSLAGTVEGTVASLGLFYTTLFNGGERTLVPNNVLLQIAVKPVSEPERVELRARFDADVTPLDVQRMIDSAITVPVRYSPDISLEELDRDEVVVKISATPANPHEGAMLAAEVLAAVREDGGDTDEHEGTGTGPA
jgi:small-conductance mechanosensitive channel